MVFVVGLIKVTSLYIALFIIIAKFEFWYVEILSFCGSVIYAGRVMRFLAGMAI